jgi:hypothetical protein
MLAWISDFQLFFISLIGRFLPKMKKIPRMGFVETMQVSGEAGAEDSAQVDAEGE